MNLRKLIFTNNDCYKAGKKIVVKGIMVHSTGANNPNLRRYVGPDDGLLGKNTNNNHWNQKMDRQVCVHGFIGKLADGSIATYQTLPWDHRGWHAGGAANNTHIGFEICEDGLTDVAYFNKVYKEAVELCAYLCEMYNLDPIGDGVIIGHYEGYKRGIASNHGDPKNWFPKHGKSMDTFRADVKALLQKDVKPAEPEKEEASGVLYRVQTGAYTKKANADAQLAKVKTAGFDTYMVEADGYYKIQVGAYSKKSNAEAMAAKLKAAGFDTYITTKAGTPASATVVPTILKVGDKVKLDAAATVYGKTTKFRSWVYTSTLYVREIAGDRVVISTLKSGAVTGATHKKYLTKI